MNSETRNLSLLKGADWDRLVPLVLLNFIWCSQEDELGVVTDPFLQYFPGSSRDTLWLFCYDFCNFLLWNPQQMVMIMLICW